MDNRPIGVFDSGVGGLTTVRELHRLLPGESIVYFGDTGRVPYGTRSRETIRKYAAQDIRFLMRHDVKAIVAACGTVSANFLEKDVRDLGADVFFTEVVWPATRRACALSAQGRIGVIATPAAIRSGAYGKAVRSIAPGAKVFGNACPLLVPLAENGMTGKDCQIARLTLEMYLKPLIAEGIDTLILGCTHYPLFFDLIGDVLEYKVTLIDSGAAAAKAVQAALLERGLLAGEPHEPVTEYYVTDAVEGFREVARHFLGDGELGSCVTHVDLRQIEDETTVSCPE